MVPNHDPESAAADRLQFSSAGGRFVVAVILSIALTMGMFAWWWNYHRGRRALDFLGPEAAQLVRTAPRVEILTFEPTGHFNISTARGLLNARTSLLGDASYDWSAPLALDAVPQVAVRFSDGSRAVTFSFNFDQRSIQLSRPSGCQTATLKQKTADGWRAYIDRQLRSAARANSPDLSGNH